MCKRNGEWRVQLPLVGFSTERQVIRGLPSQPAALKCAEFWLKYRTK